MKKNYHIILNYIKDLSVEIPDNESLIAAQDNISKYQMKIDIYSNPLKNKVVDVGTKITYLDPTENIKKSHFEMLYASVIKIDGDMDKKSLEKIILIDLQNEIYPKIKKIFMELLSNSGLTGIKFDKEVDFQELYNQNLN